MAFRRSVIASWLFVIATLSGQTVEELRAKLQAAEVDKAVMAERARDQNPTSAVLIALIGAIPALYAAYLTHLGNKMVKRGTELTQSLSAKSLARSEVQHASLESIAAGNAADSTCQNEGLARDISRIDQK